MPTVAAPDKGQLSYIGNYFIDESKKLDDLVTQLKLAKFTPGLSPAAVELKNRFKERTDGLITFFTKIASAFRVLGLQMIKIEVKYDTTEDINKADADRLTQLIASLKDEFPGIESVIPTTPDDYYNTYFPPPGSTNGGGGNA